MKISELFDKNQKIIDNLIKKKIGAYFMGKSKKLLAEDTVIVWNDISVGEYRNFIKHTIGKKTNFAIINYLKWRFWNFV